MPSRRALYCFVWLVVSLLSAGAYGELAATSSVVKESVLCEEKYIKYKEIVEEFHAEYPDFWHVPKNIEALRSQLIKLSEDGLDPAWYLPSADIFEEFFVKPPSQCQVRKLTYSYIKALYDLKFGRIDPYKNEELWYATPLPASEKLGFIRKIIVSSPATFEENFDKARPNIPWYLNLRKGFHLLQQQLPASWPMVDGGKLLRKGDSGYRVGQVLERLRHEPMAIESSHETMFDSSLENAVKLFQKRRGLQVDGIVGPNTLEALNQSPRHLLDQVRINLERVRWWSNVLPDHYLSVDLAGAVIKLIDKKETIWSSRVQVGMVHRPTPSLISYLSHITLNPTWTVPPTILRRDKLPEIRKDIQYLSKHRIRVLDSQGRVIDPHSVNWNNPGRITLRQDAGADSALGLVAFRFPNPFYVYLHDTPSKALFERETRLFSSGCVRVENAMELARLLFENTDDSVKRQFESLLASGKTANLSLPAPVPLLMGYVTAAADAAGNIQFRRDIYQRDGDLIQRFGES